MIEWLIISVLVGLLILQHYIFKLDILNKIDDLKFYESVLEEFKEYYEDLDEEEQNRVTFQDMSEIYWRCNIIQYLEEQEIEDNRDLSYDITEFFEERSLEDERNV